MKKLILLLFLTFSFLSFSPNHFEKPSKDIITNVKDTKGCKYGQCQATAKSTGNRCKHCVSNSGDTTCYQH